jgi:anthranilate phosphoribosyltransferase
MHSCAQSRRAAQYAYKRCLNTQRAWLYTLCMSFKHLIKELGRGKDGARDLSAADAEVLMHAMLKREMSDMELGAVAIALRVKGESLSEMQGFMRAAEALLPDFSATTSDILVSIPSYNGARKLPNLVPLLASALAARGLQVVVHGYAAEESRVGTEAIFRAMGLPVLESPEQMREAFAAKKPCYLPLQVLSPELHQLLRVREVLGLRNSAHSMVKLLNLLPRAPGRHLLVTSYTHPAYAQSMSEYLVASHSNALLMRGTEGEAVADARRAQAIDFSYAGSMRTVQEAHAGVLAELPALPAAIDAESTARFTEKLLGGEARPMPKPIAQQIERIVECAALLRTTNATH